MLRAFAGARLRSPSLVGSLQAHAILAVTDEWQRGWSLHEARRPSPAVALRGLDTVPGWSGADDVGSVAIIDEQGLGDVVLMTRWIPWLIERTGRTPRFYGRAALRRWIEAAGCEFVEKSVRASSLDAIPTQMRYRNRASSSP